VQIVKDQASEVMAASDLLVVASGTATLQAAVIGTPMILVYKTTLPTYWVARLLIRVKWIGLVNLVAGRTIVPELIQDEANAERLIGEVRALLNDREAYNRMKDGLREVRHALGEPGASRRAARVVLEECRA
jgi:lipid-A-disaccharide synthase